MVVYENYSRASCFISCSQPDVYGYLLPFGPPFLIVQNASSPDIEGNNMTYVGNDSAGHDQIFIFNLTTSTTRQLTTAISHKSIVRISGIRIIWTDNRNGDDDIWMYDLSGNTEGLLAGGPGSQTEGDISNNRVVYTDNDSSVYMFTIATPPTPLQKLQKINNSIQDLVNSSILNKGQGNALMTKLRAVTMSLDKGNNDAAINVLHAFNNQVMAYNLAGILTMTDTQSLIDAVNNVISMI